MALGVAPALLQFSIRQLIHTPTVDNLRVARARVRQGTATSLAEALGETRDILQLTLGTGICWLRGQTAGSVIVNAALNNLEASIKRRVPIRSGNARRSVVVGEGHPNLPVVYHFDFDSTNARQYHAGIKVPYAPYLKGVDQWFNDICDQWYEETAQRALEAFLIFYTRCATRSSLLTA